MAMATAKPQVVKLADENCPLTSPTPAPPAMSCGSWHAHHDVLQLCITELGESANQGRDNQQERGVWDEDADELESGWDLWDIARGALVAKRDALKREMVEVEKELHETFRG